MKISVIIPCYNCASTIQIALNSVLNQTYPVNEVICINDGSIDNTLNILNSYKERFPSSIGFKVLNQSNSGPSVARNQGIDIAANDWIAFLDSDDYWTNQKIEEDVKFVERFPNANLISSDDISKKFIKISFNKLLFKNYFTTSSVFVKKECISKIIFNDNQRYSEDYRVWLNIAHMHDSYVKSPKTTFPIDSSKTEKGFYMGNGLSSHIWDMQKSEIYNYYHLYKSKKIVLPTLLMVSSFSLIKFSKRSMFIVNNRFRNIFNK